MQYACQLQPKEEYCCNRAAAADLPGRGVPCDNPILTLPSTGCKEGDTSAVQPRLAHAVSAG